ncbi:hypothetical protein BDR22DRAFT_821621 [Usnea florida]
MAGSLPEGLVNNKKGAQVGIEEAIALEADDTLKLWRIYSSGNAAIAENVGRRLENFFWRISMSQRVRERLSGAHISEQFNGIRQGGYIRTTPKPSPRSSKSLGEYDARTRSNTPTKPALLGSPASPQPRPLKDDEEGSEDVSVTPTPQSPLRTSANATTQPKENRRTMTTRPPPILKNSSSGSNSSFKSSSVLTPASKELSSRKAASNDEAVIFDDDSTPMESFIPIAGTSARRSTTTRFNEEVAVSTPKASTISRSSGGRLSGENSQRSGKRNPVVVAATGVSKKRPTVMRQRSSQAASSGASKDAPSRTSSSPNLAPTTKITHTHIAQSPSQDVEELSKRHSRAASPHPLRRRKGPSPSPQTSEEMAEDSGSTETQRPPKSPASGSTIGGDIANASPRISNLLVNPAVRSNSMDKFRTSNLSLTNNPPLTHKSTAVVPTAASFQASGMLDTGEGSSIPIRNRGKEAFKNEIVPLKAPASAGPEPPVETSQPLPRTKSQLMLLLEREKNRSGT